MKALLLILCLAIATLPMQAVACDLMVEQGNQTEQQANDHDCCDTEAGQAETDCADTMNCSDCFYSSSLLASLKRLEAVSLVSQLSIFESGTVLPSHTAPPYRPPIS